MRWCGVVGTTRASFSVYTSPEDVARLARAVAGLRSAL
jgi:selenocysteine lyase/cysteine desulfurase